jgi:adenosylhomocysteine nucleosidase
MSADIAITDPCLVFALRRESMYFRRDYPFQQRFPGAPCRAQFRGPAAQSVLMLETGVGAGAMATALHWCLSRPRFGEVLYRPRLVVSVGYSGALHARQRVGDLVLATEIVDPHNKRWPAIHNTDLATRGIALGRLLTVAELVGDPHDKERLGQQYQALAVDMESAVAARVCHEQGVPFACLRVISDDTTTPLSPHLLDCLRRGRVSPARLLWTVLRHPKVGGELWRLATGTRRAAQRLRMVGSLLAMLDG